MLKKIFTDIFRKNITYDNIKSHKKSGLYLPSCKQNLGKTTGGSQIDQPAFLGLT